MSEMKISGVLLRDMFLMGAALLEKNKAGIDALNVFPVPDGDTGTNMSMTMQSATREINAAPCDTVSSVAKAAALGALKGARGNSGVILSQILRGFSRSLDGATEMDAQMLSNALSMGTEAAYKAVMKPKEGTILTVSRMMSDAVKKCAENTDNVYQLVDTMIESGEDALEKTPELLPVLREAGVVDSGGKGLITIYRGFKLAMDGEELDDYLDYGAQAQQSEAAQGDIGLDDVNDIKYGYCTELFIIHPTPSLSDEEVDKLRDKLSKIGDSVVCVRDEGLIKLHVHSNAPGKIIQLALRLGEVDKLKIENMREQNREILANLKKTETECAVVAVSMGEGVAKALREIGVSVIIEGGQTMNPSIEDIERAARRANARNVFVLPNNSNIIMAAQEAAKLSERNIIVIPSKSIMQGIAAATAYLPDMSVQENTARMTEAIDEIISGAVTYAVRDTSVSGKDIAKGDILALLNGKIDSVSDNVEEASLALLCKMAKEKGGDCVLTIFYGQDVSEEDAQRLYARAESELPSAEIIMQNGSQPLYYYYFSAE